MTGPDVPTQRDPLKGVTVVEMIRQAIPAMRYANLQAEKFAAAYRARKDAIRRIAGASDARFRIDCKEDLDLNDARSAVEWWTAEATRCNTHLTALLLLHRGV